MEEAEVKSNGGWRKSHQVHRHHSDYNCRSCKEAWFWYRQAFTRVCCHQNARGQGGHRSPGRKSSLVSATSKHGATSTMSPHQVWSFTQTSVVWDWLSASRTLPLRLPDSDGLMPRFSLWHLVRLSWRWTPSWVTFLLPSPTWPMTSHSGVVARVASTWMSSIVPTANTASAPPCSSTQRSICLSSFLWKWLRESARLTVHLQKFKSLHII